MTEPLLLRTLSLTFVINKLKFFRFIFKRRGPRKFSLIIMVRVILRGYKCLAYLFFRLHQIDSHSLTSLFCCQIEVDKVNPNLLCELSCYSALFEEAIKIYIHFFLLSLLLSHALSELHVCLQCFDTRYSKNIGYVLIGSASTLASGVAQHLPHEEAVD